MLFDKFANGAVTFANRVVMAPMTRCRAVTGNYPALLPTPGEYAKVIAVDGRRRVASTVAA